MNSDQSSSSKSRSGQAVKKLFERSHKKKADDTVNSFAHRPPPVLSSDSYHGHVASDSALEEAKLEQRINEVKDYQLTHGSVLKLVRFEDHSSVPARPVGVSVLPTPFPRWLFEDALAIQPLFTELYLRAASNHVWLKEVFSPLLKQDPFANALYKILLKVNEAGLTQTISCGLFRSDYMLHVSDYDIAIKQVELNTFSVAGACHAERVGQMHRHLQQVYQSDQVGDKVCLFY